MHVQKQMLIHICNNFIASKVHSNLVQYMSRASSIRQIIFVPIRAEAHRGLFEFTLPDVEIIYRKCQGGVIRYFPLLKILITLLSFLYSIKGERLREGRVLAHTLWSDGCVAYLFKLIAGVSYSVVVRNTDVNWFIPRLPHYRWLISKILANAETVVFVSSAHCRRFKETYPRLYTAARSVEVIPNGIEEFWFDNLVTHQVERAPVVGFVGRFDKNKNLDGLVEAVELARRELADLKLVLIGGSIDEACMLLKRKELPPWVECLGRVTDLNYVRDRYREIRVFALASHTETFGLVYIEALTQGCPFIYTKNEGVDGFFDGAAYCAGVSSESPAEISNAIVDLSMRYPDGIETPQLRRRVEEFRWCTIADRYLRVMGIHGIGGDVSQAITKYAC